MKNQLKKLFSACFIFHYIAYTFPSIQIASQSFKLSTSIRISFRQYSTFIPNRGCSVCFHSTLPLIIFIFRYSIFIIASHERRTFYKNDNTIRYTNEYVGKFTLYLILGKHAKYSTNTYGNFLPRISNHPPIPYLRLIVTCAKLEVLGIPIGIKRKKKREIGSRDEL